MKIIILFKVSFIFSFIFLFSSLFSNSSSLIFPSISFFISKNSLNHGLFLFIPILFDISIYLFAYGILSFYHSLLQEAYQLLKECWANYQKISDPMPKFKASGKLCILQLCQISNELSLVREELEWLSIADTFYDDNDEWYKANVLLRKKSVFVNRDAEIEKLCDDKLCSIFQQDFIAKNNSNLNLFLQYRYSCIWKDFNNIESSKIQEVSP